MRIDKKDTYNIIIEDFSKKITYDGSQISSRYASQHYDVIGNSILIFRGSMRLSPTEMIDIKDIQRESHLNEILISSDDSLHFIIEEFDNQPPNLEIEYYRLRLLTQIIIELLELRGIKVSRKGTDIFVNEKKLNVGIASVGVSSSKIHFGINVGNTGFPSHVVAIGLMEIGFEEDELEDWILNIANLYIEEIKRIKEDIAKTKSLE